MAQAQPERSKRAIALFAVGAVVGLGCALVAILGESPFESSPEPFPSDAAAVVNGVAVPMEMLEQALQAIASDSRRTLTQADQDFVLNRLIEQELIVQRARDLGFDQRDRMVRNTMIAGMVQSITSSAHDVSTDDAAIESFYAENSAYFARTDRAWIREIRIAINAEQDEKLAQERAEGVVARLRMGEPFESVAEAFATPAVAPLPDGFLPPAQLRNYLGPTPARAALALTPGEVSEPIRGGSNVHVLVMVDRVPGVVPPLDAVRELVITEMHRRAGEQALRDYIDNLVQQADIRKAAP